MNILQFPTLEYLCGWRLPGSYEVIHVKLRKWKSARFQLFAFNSTKVLVWGGWVRITPLYGLWGQSQQKAETHSGHASMVVLAVYKRKSCLRP